MSKKTEKIQEEKKDEAREDISSVSVSNYAQQAYLDYAMSVVCGRAIPYVEDGQKPVQRRTIFTMSEMRLAPEGKPVKSAKIIGTVLGSYHPHGDQSVYDAMVRQTQDFVMRYPLVHGEGNFGSRDGDGAAAMRYCFVGDTLIHTEQGLERISDMAPSEVKSGQGRIDFSVRSLKGVGQAIKWLFSGVQPTLKIKTELGFEVTCTPNEPLYLLQSNGKCEWTPVQHCRIGDALALSFGGGGLVRKTTPLPAEASYLLKEEDDTDTFFRFLAYFYSELSEGFSCVDQSRASNVQTISFRFAGKSNRDLLPEFKTILAKMNVEFFENNTLEKTSEQILFEGKIITINSPHLYQIFSKLGLIYSKRLSPILLSATQNQVEVFLSTLQGISSYFERESGQEFLLIERSVIDRGVEKNFDSFMSELQILALSSGVVLKTHKDWNPMVIPKNLTSMVDGFLIDKIESIDLAGSAPVYDLTVQETHAFVANGFVAHNTEAKLSKNSKFLLGDLSSGTVDFRPNYDGTTTEPEVLPARLPFILMNGAEGVGVGMACSIPPHRAKEVTDAAIALLKNPDATFEEVMSHIPGPDFPTGGQLIQSRDKILSAYKEGNGTLKLRGSWIVETGARGAWKLIVKELPYGVSAQKLMEQVDALLNPKPKEKGNKKEFTQDQLRLKQLLGGMIDVYRDESGKDQPIRVVFEPKSSKQSPDELVQALLSYTSLQDVIRLNFVAVGRDRRPAQKGIVTMLKEWSEFRVEITKRRLEHEKMVAEKRLHIVQGRIKVIDAIREAIDLIQSADDPKKALMERFELSEVQATDVLDMRLRQLAKLEGQALEKERNELEKTIARLSRLLAKTKELVQLVIQEIEDDIKLLGDDPRRTVVEEIAEVDEGVSKGKVTSKLPEDPITVALSEKFWVRAKTGHDQPAEGFVFKTGDTVASLLNSTTHETLVIMDHTGRIYNLDASEIPNARGGEGLPLSASFEAQGKFVNAWMTKEGRKYLIASDAGHGFVAPSADMLTRMKAGKVMLTPVANSLPMAPIEVTGLAEDTRVYCLSTDGSLVGFALSELPEMGKGKGVALMGLREGCKVASIVLASPQEKVGIKEGEKVKWLKFEELELAFGPRSSGKKGKVVTKLKDVKLVKE